VIRETVIGTGYISVRNQLENRLAYLRRPITTSSKTAAAKRRLERTDESHMKNKLKEMDMGV